MVCILCGKEKDTEDVVCSGCDIIEEPDPITSHAQRLATKLETKLYYLHNEVDTSEQKRFVEECITLVERFKEGEHFD